MVTKQTKKSGLDIDPRIQRIVLELTVSWREISITLTDTEKGEVKAHACVIA
jgi:hypothetical protein